MSKDNVPQWDATAANNTDVGGVNIAENCPPSGINNAIRAVMSQVKLYAPTGHLYGLTLSNNATDATNDIDIAAGQAASEDASCTLMILASVLTKRLDAAWAVGTGNGGLDTGVIANTTYHVHLIKRPDTGVVDALFSTSATAPTMPANYTLSRRIGSIIRTGGAITIFVQYGDRFVLAFPAAGVSATNPGTSAVTFSAATPAGIVTRAILNCRFVDISADGNANYLWVTPISISDTAPSASRFSVAMIGDSGGLSAGSGVIEVETNTSSQMKYRIASSDANIFVDISVAGWVDTRGRT